MSMWDQFQAVPTQQGAQPGAPASDLAMPQTVNPLDGLQGDEYMSALEKQNPAGASVVKQIGEGRAAYPTGFIMKTPYGRWLTQALGQAYPGMDAAQFAARQAQRKNYMGGGKQFQELQGISTVAGHLQNLMKSADDLNNFENLGPLNAPVNAVVSEYRSLSQDPRLAKFNTDKQAVMTELGKAYRGGQVTEGELKQWQGNLGTASTPTQLRTVIGELNDLLMSKRQAIEEGYKQTMGTNAPLPQDFSSVNDRTRKIFEDVDSWAKGVPSTKAQPPAAIKPGSYVYDPSTRQLVPQ